ncbi:hypothetical protein ACQP3C_27625, partial [Escherichia coli]
MNATIPWKHPINYGPVVTITKILRFKDYIRYLQQTKGYYKQHALEITIMPSTHGIKCNRCIKN